MKPYAGSGTGFADKYRNDSFFRTEVHIVVMLLLFSLLIVTLFSMSSNYLYEHIASALIEGTKDNIASEGEPSIQRAIILGELEYIRTENLRAVLAVSIAVTAIFGWIMARIMLVPARKALELQRQFIGSVAHELRTPLSIVRANTELSLYEQDLERHKRSIFESNIEELDRISDIIKNLLTLNAFVRTEHVNFSEIDFSKTVLAVVEKLDELRRNRGLEIMLSLEDSSIVWGNAAALEQIAMNILKNAINYTPSGGRIDLSLSSVGRYAEFRVEDSGIGIEKKDLSKIFEPFYRSTLSRQRRRGGSGLGLVIVSDLVRLHNGKITMASFLGRGTRVTVTLPRERDQCSLGPVSPLILGENEVALDFTRKTS